MTLRVREMGEMPADTGSLGAKLLREGNLYRVIGERLADVVRDEDFADLYAAGGQAAVSPALLALVTLFQFREGVPDRAAAEQVVARIDWKYALRLPLDYAGFHYSDLCNFRKRLVENKAERRVFDLLLGRLVALGYVKKRGKQRTDSIAVLGAVRELSALETVTETLRLAVRAAEAAAPEWAAAALPPEFRERYARSAPDYRMKAEERQAEMLRAGADGAWLAERLAEAPPALRGSEAAATLAAVWEQRFEREGDTVRARKGEVDCTERVVTPHDPGVRAGEKRGWKWRGDKVHVTETAEEGGPNFLVDVATAPAPSGDAKALPGIRARLERRDLLPAAQYVDASYVSGRGLAESAAAGVRLVGPPLPDTTPNRLKIADFALDYEARTATCPAGVASATWSDRVEPDGSAAVYARFPAAACAACPLRPDCTEAEGGRTLHVGEFYPLLAARRAEAETPEFKAEMRARPAIEATLSELTRGHGLRRHRYRGEAKRHLENLLKGASCNLKRLARALAAGIPPAGTAGAAAA